MTVIPLDGILGLGGLDAPAPAGGGCSTSACGSPAGSNELAPEIWEKVKDHPCYSEQAHQYFARMHVALAPACNIQCNYCNRKYDCSNESRPGVVSERLTPEQAVRKVMAVVAEVPQLSVVGIAGPDDSLAAGAKNTFRTFDLLREAAPDIRLCLSTNGLALPDHVQRIKDLGCDHVTVTINAVDPEAGERIYPWIFFDHRRWTGRDAAKILYERQMEGLEALSRASVLIKVNSVLIPGVNDDHMAEVNAKVKTYGAFLHNIMPLISDPAHGTHFGLTGQRGPTAQELKAVQDKCEGDTRLMRHCRQCRADAVGLLGEDRGAEFSLDNLPDVDAREASEDRAAYRAHVEAERASRASGLAEAEAGAAEAEGVAPVLAAVATKGGARINEHFGHATEFQVFEVGPQGARFVGHRRVDLYCEGGDGDEDQLATTLAAIADCAAVFVAKVGPCPAKGLADAGIEPVDAYAYEYIEECLLAWFAAYAERIEAGSHRPRAGADAVLRTGAFVARRA